MKYVGAGPRFAAQLIDFLVLGISVLLVGFMADLAGAVHQFAPAAVWALSAFLPAAYFIGLEAELGATAGKLVMGQRVVMEDGSPIGWRASAIRNALRLVDGIFFYLVGAILVWNSDRRQRLGDRVAGTVVVRKASLGEMTAPPISARQPAPISSGSAPSRWWYALAGLISVAGLATAGVLVVRMLGEVPDTLTRVVVPGEAVVDLAEPGTYTIYHEYHSVVDARVYSSGGELSSLRVTLETFDGRPVNLDSPGGTFEYAIGGRSGVAVLTFRAQEPGTYRMTAHYPAGEGPEAVLAVGRGWDRDILVGFLAALGVALLAGAGALAITIITFLKRGKARQRVGADIAAV
ncbi:MAG: RDD family protein [Actinobacteria bacterium]|nr:RDD family protein [Actinomycetota bacterium]